MSRFSIPSLFLILCSTFVYGINTEPVITLNGPNPQYVDSGGVYEELGAVAYDNEDGSLTDQIVISGSVNTNYPGNYTIQYVVTDSDGNSTVMNRTVTVTDQTPPVIILQGNSTVSVEVFNSYTELGAIATDEFDGDLSSSIIIAGTVNTSIIGVYSIVYSVTDSHGNTASVTRTVIVVDTTPPVIILNGDSTIYLELGSTYTELGATATDNYDGNLSSEIFLSGSVDTSTEGTYYISYNVSDSSGNSAASVQRTVVVVEGNSPSILVTKTASPDSGVFAVGDVITYTIKVKNTGNSDLNTLTIVDTLKDLGDQGLVLTTGPVFTSSTDANTTFTSDPNTSVPTLLVGEEVTFTATFAVTQAAIDAGGVKNTVSVTATADDADNTSVTDATDSPVITTITQTPAITVTKTADVDHVTGTDSETTTGDTIVYTITIANTGNVTLTGIDITDTMTDGAGQSLTRTSPSTFSTYTLAPGETEEIEATYTIEQSAADTGSISNTVSVVGTAPDGTEISDDIDAPVVVLTDLNPSIEVIKVAAVTEDGDGIIGVGDTIQYTITVENTGNVTLSGLSLTDTLTDLNGDPLILTTPLTFVSSGGSPEGTLSISEVATYSTTYVIEQSAVDAGGVFNTATAECILADGITKVADVSDNATPTNDEDGDGSLYNDPTLVLTNFFPAMELNMTVESVSDNGDGITGVGDTITYSISIANTGNITLSNIYQTYTLTDFNDTALMLTTDPVFVGSSKGSSGGTLLPGEIANYIATYVIDESAADSGGISNRITAFSSTPSGIDDVSAWSGQSPITVLTNSYIGIDLIKSATIADTSGDGSIGLGDTITYTLVATNTGNVELSGVMIVDVFSDLAGNSLILTSGPFFISASLGSEEGSLQIGEQATYRATFIINSQAMNAGGVSNTASASAISPSGVTVSDISDDGDDTDGNTENDPTVTTFTSQPIDNENILLNGNVYITKSNGLIIKSGDDCYRIKVNNGNVVAEPVNCEQ